MSEPQPSALKPGTIAWHDLTCADALKVRDFYAAVAGWAIEPAPMRDGSGTYEDYAMHAAGADAVAGVCHARGVNADLPSQWLMYIVVADIARSIDACREHGGEVIAGPRPLLGGTFCVVRDPAGAVCALWQTGGR